MAEGTPAAVYDLLTHINLLAAEAGTPLERVRRLARLFSSPRETLDHRNHQQAMTTELEKLCAPLVYMVLNVPLSIERQDERVFMAVIDPSGALPPQPTGPAPSDENLDHCDVLFFERDGVRSTNHQHMSALHDRWRNEWQAYGRLTKTLQTKRVFTWNQFLLHGCNSPAALGLAWEPAAAWPYVDLTAELAAGLELPRQHRDEASWHQQLVALPTGVLALDSTIATDIEARLAGMGPHSSVDLKQTAALATYHLARSYAIWGGDGFVSLPVLLGVSLQKTDRAVAVLSLCSRPNLSGNEILTWHSIAAAVFGSINAAELAEHGELRERIKALEGTGHALKWAAELTAWEPVSKRLQSAIENPRMYSPGLLRTAASSLELVALVQGLGNLVRVVGTIAKGYLEKLAEWYDVTEHQKWECGDVEDVVSAYAELCFQLGRVVCFGTGWPSLHVEAINATANVREWHAEASSTNTAFEPHLLRAPPFRRGSDAVYVMIAALGEPMTNATDAMKRDHIDQAEPLRVRIRADLPHRLTVEVGNPTRRAMHDLPPGVRDTQALIRATGVAEYKRPYNDAAREQFVWVPVDVHPLGLSHKIRDDIERRRKHKGG